MNVDFTLVISLLTLFSLVGMWLYMVKTLREYPEIIKEDIVTWLGEPENQAAIQANMEALADMVKLKMSNTVAGQLSGVSRNMAKMDNEINEGVMREALTPVLYDKIKEYAEDRPWVQFLMDLAKNEQIVNLRQQTGLPVKGHVPDA